MQRLIDLGFKKVGAWRLKDDGEIVYTLSSDKETRNLVYCFVSEGKIKYVGKTVNQFYIRLEGYYRPGEIHEKIISQLNRKKAITIWILVDTGELKFKNHILSLADALEMALIKNIVTNQ